MIPGGMEGFHHPRGTGQGWWGTREGWWGTREGWWGTMEGWWAIEGDHGGLVRDHGGMAVGHWVDKMLFFRACGAPRVNTCVLTLDLG